MLLNVLFCTLPSLNPKFKKNLLMPFLLLRLLRTQTPFCSEYYALPGCPSSGSPYTKPQHEPRDYYSTPSGKSYPDEEGGGSCSVGCDHFGNICKADSGASSSASRKKKVTNNQSLTRQRPLALAVGYGDYWKDNEGRRVVITSSRRQAGGRASPPHRTSPVTAGKVKLSPACTCGSGSHKRNNSILSSPEKESKHNVSPHQTKSVMCKLCADRLKNNRNLDPVVSSSHGAAAAAAITPQLV